MATLVFVPYEHSTTGNMGTLCVKEAINSFSSPERHIHFWPVSETSRLGAQEMFPELDTEKEITHYGNGVYGFYRGYGYYSPKVALKDGGQTKPIKTIVEPIPAPKVRKTTPTRYQNGIWEKYLQSSGWIVA